jgi:hypothetical protein
MSNKDSGVGVLGQNLGRTGYDKYAMLAYDNSRKPNYLDIIEGNKRENFCSASSGNGVFAKTTDNPYIGASYQVQFAPMVPK